jgi:nucleoside-diphosphate-sugar epimerase
VTRVLLTGASGLIGRHASAALLARGYEVHAVRSAEYDLLSPAGAHDAVAAVRPEALLHLAWDTEHGAFWTSTENLRWVEATLRLLRAFVELGGTRAVLAGSCAEYDWSAPSPYSEATSPLRPSTLYGAAKHGLHTIAAAFAEQHGVSLAWGRVFFLTGPGEAPGRLVPSVARALLDGRRAEVSAGLQVRDFLAARDVADGFAALLASDVTGAVNVASGEPIQLRDVIGAVARNTGGRERVDFGAVPTRPSDPPELVADVGRLRDEVGWRPSLSLDEAIEAAVAGLRQP